MKKVIILSTVALRYLNLSQIPAELSLYVVLDEMEISALTPELEKVLSGKKVIQGSVKSGPLIELNESATEIAVQEILSTDLRAHWTILSFNESLLFMVARLNQKFHIAALTESQLEPYQNKLTMKLRLEEKGLRVPRHTHFDTARAMQDTAPYFSELREQLALPFILKPTSSCGSYGVCRVNTLADFDVFVKTVPEDIAYEAEEFIQGTLYHCDTAIRNGQIIFSECATYTCPGIDFFKYQALGSAMLFSEDDPLRQRILTFTEQCLTAVGKMDGVSHLELFVTPKDELIFLEVGARPPGASVAQMVEHDRKVNLINVHLCLLTQTPYAIATDRVGYSMHANLPMAEGIVEALLEPVLTEGHCDIQWLVKPGERLQASQSIVEMSGRLFATFSSLSALQKNFEILKQYKPLKLKH
jgi:hypothetical protein